MERECDAELLEESASRALDAANRIRALRHDNEQLRAALASNGSTARKDVRMDASCQTADSDCTGGMKLAMDRDEASIDEETMRGEEAFAGEVRQAASRSSRTLGCVPDLVSSSPTSDFAREQCEVWQVMNGHMEVYGTKVMTVLVLQIYCIIYWCM